MEPGAEDVTGTTPRRTGGRASTPEQAAPLYGERLFKLARLCGISPVTMYGLSAAIGDIQRFRHSKKLVAYLGLNPSVCQSGNFEGLRGAALVPERRWDGPGGDAR